MPRILRSRKPKNYAEKESESLTGDTDTSQSSEASVSLAETDYILSDVDENDMIKAIDQVRREQTNSTKKKRKRSFSVSSKESNEYPMFEVSCQRILDMRELTLSEWNSFLLTLPQTTEHIEGSALRRHCPRYFARASKKEAPSHKIKRYLVKWTSLSFIHASWEDIDAIECFCYPYQGEKYWKKRFEDFDTNGVFNIKPFCAVERVLDTPDDELLIKWENLGYDDCTYEYRHDVLLFCPEQKLKKKISRHRKRAFVQPKKNLSSYTSKMTFKNNNKLRPYQIESVEWLTFNIIQSRNSILADEMGLGKTLQAICFMHRLCFSLKVKPRFLVIAPLATLDNWMREIESWTNFYAVCFHGSKFGRDIVKNHELKFGFNIVVTNYETALQEASYLGGFDWNLLVVDEAHRLKNDQSKLNFVLKKRLKIKRILLLTGTPIQNNLRELWTLLNFVDEEKFHSWSEFESLWEDLTDNKVMDKFQDMLRPYVLRRVKHDVEKLPPKEDTLIEVEMTTLQKRFYRAIYERNRNYLRNATKKAYKNDKLRIRNGVSLKNIAIQLRKCCNHPYLLNGVEATISEEISEKQEKIKSRILSDVDFKKKFEEFKRKRNKNVGDGYTEDEIDDFNVLLTPLPNLLFEKLIRSSGKLILLDKLLPKLKKDGHRILLFSQWVRVLDILQDYLSGRNYSFERIDGTIKNNERQLAIDRFNEQQHLKDVEENTFVFLLSTRACGQGINLTAADTVILYDGDWNPQNDIQALARCHRIGQTKTVRIYRLITSGSYEQTMFLTASRKLGLDMAITSRLETRIDKGKNNEMVDSSIDTEQLIKYGAFALAGDSETKEKEFLNEDIDHILQNRSISLNNSSSNTLKKLTKAKFGVNDANNDLDISDPAFWEKIVGVEGFDENAFQHENILHNKRKRKHVVYNVEKIVDAISSDEASEYEDLGDKVSIFSDDNLAESTKNGLSQTQVTTAKKVPVKDRTNTNGNKKKKQDKSKPFGASTHKRPTTQKTSIFATNEMISVHYPLQIVAQWFSEVDPISGLIYRPSFVGALVYKTIPPNINFLQSFSTHKCVHVAKRNQDAYYVTEFYKCGIQDNLFKRINKYDDIKHHTLAENKVINSHVYARVLDYVICFGVHPEIQGLIVNQLRSTSYFQRHSLQPEINEIVKAAAIFLIVVLYNYEKFLSKHVSHSIVTGSERAKVSREEKTYSLIPSGFIGPENPSFSSFQLDIPSYLEGNFIRKGLISAGYIYISALFSTSHSYRVPDPTQHPWLITLSYDIVWNVERGYILKMQSNIS